MKRRGKKGGAGEGWETGAGFVQPPQSVSDTAGAAVSSIAVLFTGERSFHVADRARLGVAGAARIL